MKKLFLIILAVMLFTSCSMLQKGPFTPKMKTGLDVLSEENFVRLDGKRIGLISNHSAVDRDGNSILELMKQSDNVNLAAIFAPEHGFGGSAEEQIKDQKDPQTGLMIYSLYDDTKRPTKEELEGIDLLIFDIQDIGARFYTYTSTMAMCMEEAARYDIDFMVLDRPNPISGLRVGGPLQDPDLYESFTAYFPMPIIHGMTIGELAMMFNEYYGVQCDLTIVQMEGWKRAMYFDDTGLPWVNPSPNIRNVKQAILYPGIALTEAWNSNVSVGRGTETPFELMGAPWINAEEFVEEMNSRNIPGFKLTPVHYTPDAAKFPGEECHGMYVEITDRQDMDIIGLGLHMLSALHKLYPDTYKLMPNRGLVGSTRVMQMIEQGASMDQIRAVYSQDLNKFIKARNNFILYKL